MDHEFKRHWGVSDLKDPELPDACAHVYGRPDGLIHEASERFGSSLIAYEDAGSSGHLQGTKVLMIEKREAARVPFRCEVECEEVQSGTRPRNPMIADLSTTGLFVDTTMTFDEGAIVKLCFTLPSMEIRVTADVVHPMPTMGMGLRFRELTPAQKIAIEEVVKAGGSG